MQKSNNISIITTEDGSHTIRVTELDETYHSIHGAIQESQHVFIEAGLKYYMSNHPHKTSLKILEFGFGTGLNALLTAKTSSIKIDIAYHTLEKYPVPQKIINALNYSAKINKAALFKQIHGAEWEDEHRLNQNFSIKKINIDFRDYATETHYDIIYFDAFAPSKQPDLWDKSIFKRCYQLLNAEGILVTYSAKGQLKRDLKAVGFTVESIPGPPGKYEMTRATKITV